MLSYDEIKKAFKEGLDADPVTQGRFVIIDPKIMNPGDEDPLALKAKASAWDMHIILEYWKDKQKLGIHHKFNIPTIAYEYDGHINIPVEGFIKQIKGYIEEGGVNPEETPRGKLEQSYQRINVQIP